MNIIHLSIWGKMKYAVNERYLDDSITDLELMQSNIKVTKNLQIWCFNDLDVCGSISNRLHQ